MKNENQIQPRRASAEPATYDRAKWRATIITATFAASVEGNTQSQAYANASEMVTAWNAHDALAASNAALVTALERIATGITPTSNSILEAKQCVKEYKAIATAALARAKEAAL